MERQHEDAAVAGAKAEQLFAKAQASLAACRQMFADTGVTGQSCLQNLRRAGGEAAVRKVQSEVDDILRGLQAEAARDQLHAPVSGLLSRHVARRGGV